LPPEALANDRWVGDPPPELEGLTWIEERPIARAQVSGVILRLQRNSNNSYLGLKGHAVVFPQDTRRLLDLLPFPRAELADHVRVVWTGKTAPTTEELRPKLTVRTERVFNALKWLCANNEDYKDHITINDTEVNEWPPVFIANELIDTMAFISENVAEEIARAGVSVDTVYEEPQRPSQDAEEISMSGLLDVNNTTQSIHASTLERVASLTDQHIIHVVSGGELRSHWDDPSYFTSAFPPIFPYGHGKHIVGRRRRKLPFHRLVSLFEPR
jgi:hypothetical protein